VATTAGIASGIASGCGLLRAPGAGAIEDAHVVWLTETGCPHFVAKTRNERFALFLPLEPYAPRRGDTLIGGLRPGSVLLRLIPIGAEPHETVLRADVLAFGMPLPDVQDAWREVCPVPRAEPPPPVPVPGHPPAVDG
jgi:hypothetical protein